MCKLDIKEWLNLFMILVSAGIVAPFPPPVQNFTTITLFTDTLTWNNAKQFCSDIGGKLLDPTYYSIYNTLFMHASVSPWKDLPIANGPPAWTSLHRRITPVGDDFYSDTCEGLSEFNVIRWDENFGPPDGPSDAMCVLHGIVASSTFTFNDYTNANCSEKHRFYCQHEEGPCEFEEFAGYGGYTNNDGTSNDIILPFDSVGACKERCLNESYVRPGTGPNTYTEECWGFTTTPSLCIVHLVLQPRHFDSNKLYYGDRNLYIKRCFATAVNNTVLEMTLTQDSADQPSSTCGIPIVGNSSILSQEVDLYSGTWTWNEAFQTCRANRTLLLDITSDDMTEAFRQLLKEEHNLSDTLWLGLHESDPQNYPGVRVWSTCDVGENFSWDPLFTPSSDRLDTRLCTIINITSLLWQSVPCNERHQFLCLGNSVDNWSYGSGTENAIGMNVTLGPYNVTKDTCQLQCNSWTYKDMECRAYAFMASTDENLCRLYFADTFLSSDSTFVSENYTFYPKLSWNVSYKSGVVVADDSVLPYSCCDLSRAEIPRSCPSDTLSTYETKLPTTESTTFVLFTSPVEWNVAHSTCKAYGGDLVHVDGISKRHALRYYLKSWIQDGHISGKLWQGMITTNSSDTCSAKWARDCSTPEWLLPVSGSGDAQYCAAIDSDVNITFMSCNHSLSFVCEMYAASPCEMNDISLDTSCLLGQNGATATVSMSTCVQTCLTSTYDGMECWAMKPINKFACQLYFYIDPMYCKENNQFERNTDTTFKNCYEGTVNTIHVLQTEEGSILPPTPNSTCFTFTFPYASDVSRCEVESELVLSSITSMSIASTSAHFPTSMSTSLLSTSESSSVSSEMVTENPKTTQHATRSDFQSASISTSTTEQKSLHYATTSGSETPISSKSSTPEQTISRPVTTSGSTTPVSSEGSTLEQTTSRPVTTSGSTTPISPEGSTTEQATSRPGTNSGSTTQVSSTNSIQEQTTSHPETTPVSTATESFEGSTPVQTTLHPVDTSTTSASLIGSTTKETTSHQVLTSYSTIPVLSEGFILEQTTSHTIITSDYATLVLYTGSSPEQTTSHTLKTTGSITVASSEGSTQQQTTSYLTTTSGSSTKVSYLGSITEQTTPYPVTTKYSTTPLVFTISEQTTPSSVTVSTSGQTTSHPVTISDSTTLVGSTVSNSRQIGSHPVTTLNLKTTVKTTTSLSTHLATTNNFTISGSSEFSSMTLVMPTSVPSTSSNSAFSPSDKLSVSHYATKIYILPCLCNLYNKTTNLTSEQWTEWMREVNTVTVKSTSRYRRTLVSAEDRRESAVSVGNVAIGILVTITAMVILTDVLSIVWKRH